MVIVVIVTHNRSELLRASIDSILKQSVSPSEVLVIDNASTDETRTMLARDYPEVLVDASPENLGGAGGFQRGIELALSRGHSYAWLMDDDAEAEADALGHLLSVAGDDLVAAPAFVASTVIDSKTGDAIPGQSAPVPSAAENSQFGTRPDALPAAYATFVGVLINLHYARLTPLPVADFFLWWDDTEYTGRLQLAHGGMRALNGVVRHPGRIKGADLGVRLRFDIRNRIWILRDRRMGSPYVQQRARDGFWRRIRKQYVAAHAKRMWARHVVGGLWSGLTSSPTPVWANANPVGLREPGGS